MGREEVYPFKISKADEKNIYMLFSVNTSTLQLWTDAMQVKAHILEQSKDGYKKG